MKRILLFLYATVLVFLGVRPQVDFLRDRFLPESDLGGWSMYPRYVEVKCHLYLQEGENVNELDWRQYLNHGSFGSSGHPHVSRSVMKSFVDFVIDNDSLVQSVLADGSRRSGGKVIFDITKIVEERDTILFHVEKGL